MSIQVHRKKPNFPFCINGLCTCGLIESRFNEHEKQQIQQEAQRLELEQQLFGQETQGHVDGNVPVYNSNNSNSSSHAIQFEKRWEEIDQYIRFQNEQLRSMILEQEKQRVALLKNVESRSLHLLRQKDEEIAQAAKKRVELEEFLKSMEAENQEWKRVAQEKEAMALSLYKTLEEEKEKVVVVNDAESSCCGENELGIRREEAIEENWLRCGGVGDSNRQNTREVVMICKRCHSRRSCFLFLPCRHLSSCKDCEAFLEACPICGMPKKGSIEALIF